LNPPRSVTPDRCQPTSILRQAAADVFGADLRSLAVLRMGVALAVLADLASRARDLRAHYSDAGVLPRAEALTQFEWLHAAPLCLHLTGGTAWSQAVLFALAAAAAGALLVGHRTRCATPVTWFLTTSLQLRNLAIGAGYDALLRMLLFWGMFLPLGGCWSLDRLRQNDGARPVPTPILSVGTIALLTQVLVVYWSAGWAKLAEPGWHAGTALPAILADDFRVTTAGMVLARAPGAVRILGRLVVALELAGPVLLLAPIARGPIRTIAVVALCAMNLAFGIALRLGFFPWVSCVALAGLLPRWFWERALGLRSASGTLHPPGLRWPQVVCLPFLLYLLFWSVGVAGSATYRAPASVEWLGRTFFLHQDWRLFAVPPARSGWITIPGRLRDGREVDLFSAGGPAPSGSPERLAVAETRPSHPARSFRNDRWRLYLARAVYGTNADRQLLLYGRYLCREWNAARDGPEQLETFEIVFHVRPLVPPFDGEYRRDVVWTHRCFG
jgi:hypothetical protein